MRRSLILIVFSIFAIASSAAAQDEQKDGKVFWRGTVDDKVQLIISGISLEEKTISGRPQPAGGYSFTATLPKQSVTVSAAKIEGRGKVTVLQQPLEANGYTAIVEISDERGGTGDYLLSISWQ